MSPVFANNMEISGKSSANKSIAAMPDVCLSPPSPPAGPIPIPYPNTAMASDSSDGSKTVKIADGEVSLKNESKYKQSNGNEPATNSFGAGVVSHKITGAMKFVAWSMDVKFEGSNVPRFGDMTTHNHMNGTNGGMTASIAGIDVGTAKDPDCEAMHEANDKSRKSLKRSADEELSEVGKGNTVITSYIYKPAGGRTFAGQACSRKIVAEKRPGFKAGLSHEEKKAQSSKGKKPKMSSKACDGDYTYKSGPGNNRGDHTHTESKIIEDIFSDNAGSLPAPKAGTRPKLVLAIDWPDPPKDKTTASPCKNCEKLICAAAECMDIIICDADGNPKEPNCPE